jgi:hypothetical protein
MTPDTKEFMAFMVEKAPLFEHAMKVMLESKEKLLH